MKQKYVKPQISRVRLDPNQAILSACSASGVWMTDVSHCGTYYDTGILECRTGVRGVTGATTFVGVDISTAPS